MNITLCCNLMACFVRIFYHSCYVLYSFSCIVLFYLCKFSLFLQCHFINGPQFPFVLLFSVAYISYCATEFNDPYHHFSHASNPDSFLYFLCGKLLSQQGARHVCLCVDVCSSNGLVWLDCGSAIGSVQ